MEGIERPHSVLIGQPQTRGDIGSSRPRMLLLFIDLRRLWYGRRDSRRPRAWRMILGPLLGCRPIHQRFRQFFPLPTFRAEVAHPVAYLLVLRHHLVGPVF